jgi:hypothetical protein
MPISDAMATPHEGPEIIESPRRSRRILLVGTVVCLVAAGLIILESALDRSAGSLAVAAFLLVVAGGFQLRRRLSVSLSRDMIEVRNVRLWRLRRQEIQSIEERGWSLRYSPCLHVILRNGRDLPINITASPLNMTPGERSAALGTLRRWLEE